jgi:hypothetical protein
MDMSACVAPFPESELKRLLTDKSLNLYHRLKQASELKEAGIAGLESCPGCDYAAVIENPDEKLFRCENKHCGMISCRGCRKKVSASLVQLAGSSGMVHAPVLRRKADLGLGAFTEDLRRQAASQIDWTQLNTRRNGSRSQARSAAYRRGCDVRRPHSEVPKVR